jgi:hypothetical protein
MQPFAGLQINPVMAQAGVQPSGCERWQAEACAPERLPNYFVYVQQAAFAGKLKLALRNGSLPSRRQGRVSRRFKWIPACAARSVTKS